MNLDKTIALIRKGDRKAQKALYDHYSPTLFGICRRYLKETTDAEDAFLNGMSKVYEKIEKYSGKGSFEGWMKKIMVNECLMHIRKHKKLNLVVEWSQVDKAQDPVILAELAAEEIRKIILDLPEGYRTVFNLYEVEGYKHREIADLLGISINTSKSQLILAKKKLREFIKKKDKGNTYEGYKRHI